VKKVLILKNDRVGDYFTSVNSINLIINKHKDRDIIVFLSKINFKFNFIFKELKIKIFNYNLNVLEKIKIINYLIFNNISDIYILAPKNFYYILPFLFRRIKFHAVCIDSDRNRPTNFLKKFLFNKETLYRRDNSKILSVYKVLENLINYKNKIVNYKNLKFNEFVFFEFPKNATYFHYKHNLFSEKLLWDNMKIKNFIEFLAKKRKFIVFSSELDNSKKNNFFLQNFNSYDFKQKKYNKINNQNILFLDNLEGNNLVHSISLCDDVIAPESGITHIGSFLKKKNFSFNAF